MLSQPISFTAMFAAYVREVRICVEPFGVEFQEHAPETAGALSPTMGIEKVNGNGQCALLAPCPTEWTG
jgi:hypothetical protein